MSTRSPATSVTHSRDVAEALGHEVEGCPTVHDERLVPMVRAHGHRGVMGRSSSSPAGTSASKPGSSARGCHSCSRIPPRPVGSSGLTLHRSPQGRRVAVGTWTGHRCQTASVPAHYRAPGWFSRNVFNRAVAFLTRHGVSVAGSPVLAVKGRTSGAWRTTPVNLLEHSGRRYLVSPRGEGQRVRNLRVVGTGELRVGQRTEVFPRPRAVG
jgi:hypothetical protein